jgi:hypothetical protein
MMGKNRTQMRADIRLDLKDAATTWSDAELNRCIDKAVADLSRFLPYETVYETDLDFEVTDETVTFPADTDPDRIVDGADISGTSAGDTMTIAAQPDVPRPVTFTITDANGSVTILSIIVKGEDRYGDSVVEYLHYGKGGSKTGGGKVYFKYIHEIEIDQISGNGAADVLDIGIGAYTDVWVSLANKPVRWLSETLDDGSSTTYAKDTDYKIDYTNGAVKAISGGSIAAEAACEIDYTKSKISIDLSELPNFIRLAEVEYPVGEVPQDIVSAGLFDDVLTITSFPSGSQERLLEDKHVAIRYYAKHTSPTDTNPGSYPTFLDTTVELAAEAYALFMFAVKYELQSATDLASAATKVTSSEASITSATTSLAAGTTELGLTTAIHALADAAFDKVTTYVAAAGDALDNAMSESALANVALDSVASGLSDAISTLGDISALRTAIITAANACASVLGDAVGGELTDYEAVFDEEVKHILTAGVPNAQDFLETGDDAINTINTGDNVPELYRDYASIALSMANAWADWRKDMLTAASRRVEVAMAYATEMAQRLSNLRSYIEEAEGTTNVSIAFVSEAAQRVATSQSYIAIAAGRIAMSREFMDEGLSRIQEINSHIQEADVHRGIGMAYKEIAYGHQTDSNIYIQSANIYKDLSDKLREEAMERRNEVYSIWRDKRQYIGDTSVSSVRQAATYDNTRVSSRNIGYS